MKQPLALVFYEKLLPGSQLVNRLQDMNYRVQTVTNAESLTACAEQEKPLVVFADLTSVHAHVCPAIAALRQNSTTRHIPIIAFAAGNTADLQASALIAGATLVVGETAILDHLPQVLEQALQVD